VSGKRAEAGGGGGLTGSIARGAKGRRPGKRGRPSEETDAEPDPARPSEPPFRDTVRGSEPPFGDAVRGSEPVLEGSAPASNPLPGNPVRASGPFPRNTSPASDPPFCGAVRLPSPRSHHPVPNPSPPPAFPLPADAVPEPVPRDGTSEPGANGSPPVRAAPAVPAAPEAPELPEPLDPDAPMPSLGRGASPAARRPLAWAPEAGRPSGDPPFVRVPGIPGALHASHELEVLDAPGLFGVPGVPCPLLRAEPGAPSETGPEPEPEPGTGPQAEPEAGPETEPEPETEPGAEAEPEVAPGPAPEAPAVPEVPVAPVVPESPTEPECGRSKSSPVASSAGGRPAESVTLPEFVTFPEFTGFTEPVVPGGRCGGVEPAGPGARRASVLMHPPFPRTGPPFVRTRAGVVLPLLVYGPASTPLSPGTTQNRSRPEHAYPQRRTAIPGAVERPAAFPPCVRVTLRVDPARTGTSPRPRGICPERPPTLR